MLLVFGLAVPASAVTFPVQSFYGDLTIAGTDAPVGTEVIAKVAGTEYGRVTTVTEGEYGRGLDLKLVVQGQIDDGATVDFYVSNAELGLDEVKANETDLFDDGKITERNLTVDDTMAPTVSLIELTPDPTNGNTPTFTGTATDTLNNISLVEYKVDDGEWTAAEAVDGTFNSLSEEYTFTTAELTDGAHTVYVSATDAATNTSLEPYISDEFVVITYQITGLAARNPTQNSIDLTWTTPANEVNPFSYFDVRYSKATITSDNWDEATRATGEPAPAAGASQEMKIRGLDSSTTYYFAMKLVDEEGFVGLLSDIASVTTLAAAPSDEIPPARITDLAANLGSPATTRVILLWTATGDDAGTGTATSYEIRRSTSAITDEANWSSATIIYNNIVPQAAGGSESFVVSRLTPNTIYYFAIQAKDEVGNASPTSNSPSVTTEANLPTITGISPTSGENSQAWTLTIDGNNFVDGGTNVVRFVSDNNTFDLTNVTCSSSTQLTADVAKGAPTGSYRARVINDKGTSELSLDTYEVIQAETPLPLVTNLIPQMAASDSAVSGVQIFGENLTGATEVSFGDTAASNVTEISDTKITVDVPGFSAGEYDVKVTTPAGTNEISGVKFVVSDPVAITEDTTEDTTTSEVVKLDTNEIPVQLTLTTDTSETSTQAIDIDVEIEVTIPPQTTVTCEGEPYVGNINPPRVVKPDELVLTDLSDDAVVIEMGNPEKTINFDQDFVATVIITAPVQPVIWYYNKTTHAYELAGKTGTKDGFDYVPGGTKLGQENSTYTMGLLLDHMSSYVAGVKPHITSAPATVTAGSAFTITGTNFHPTAAEVYFSGIAGTIVSRTSTTQIVARFPTAGSYTLKVENPDKLSDTTSITLTTPRLSPSVTTGDATSITITSATLNGSLDGLGTVSSVAVSFEWGETTDYGNTATVTASPLSQAGAFSAGLSGLIRGTAYHFRVKAVGDGTSYGADRAFTTLITPPVVTIDAVTTPTNVATQTLSGTMEEGTTVALTADTAATFGEVTYPTAITWSCEVTLVEDSNEITATATDAVGNEGTATTTIVLDTATPTVEITSPLEGALLNSLEVTIEGTATEVDEVVVDGQTAPVVDGTFSVVLTLTEGANSVTATATDTAGNAGSDTVGFSIDVTPPVVTIGVVTTPTNVATQTLSGTMEEGATVALTADTAATFGEVTYPTATTWSCEVTLVEGSNEITAIATDAAGSTGTAETIIVLDTIAPSVVSVSPAADTTGVAITTMVRATFDEAIDEATLSFTLDGVAGSVTYTGTTATFTPSANLGYGTIYTASIQASDLAGNPMVEAHTWSFTTRAEPVVDDIPPTVTTTSPPADATGVAITTMVRATFDEATLSFTLDGVAGSVTYTGTTATFTPSANLSYGTIYTASIQASDLAGNPMVEAHTWSFTTARRPAAGPAFRRPPAPPAGTTDVRGEVSAAGVFLESVTATSEDGLCTVTIPEGTVGLTEELEPLTEITMLIMDEPPPPPEDAHIVGLAYDIGPAGATFEPPITLEYSYDPADIPEGITEEDLVVAYYDEDAGLWVELDCVVDTENNTITARVEHFTTFAIIARVAAPPPPTLPPPPVSAAFSVSNLTVQPAEVQPEETVTITVSVANTGGMEGSYSVVLKIKGVKEAEKSITIAAGGSEIVAFSVIREEKGIYSVTVDGLSASFTVVAPVPVAPPEEEEVIPEAPLVPTKPPINWTLLGGIIGAVVGLGLLAFLLIRRRAY